MICVKRIVKLNFLGLLEKFGVIMCIIYGIVIWVNVVNVKSINVRRLSVLLVNCFVVLGFCVFRFLEKSGMNVVLKVFFVKNCWNKLGKWNVIKNVFVIGFVLRVFVISIFCMNFNIWLMVVILLIVVVLCSKFI